MARASLAAPRAWDDVARHLAARLAASADERIGIEAVPPEPPRGLGAVDGGCALLLEGGGMAVGAVRAHALLWRAHARVREWEAPLAVRLLDDDLAADVERVLPGLPAARGPAELLERWRALREWELARDLAALLAPGDLLALDGPLAQQVWPAGAEGQLARACAMRGAGLVGVCKRASASAHGAPALLAAARAARGTPEPWVARLAPGRVAARLAPGGRVFRIDVAPGTDPAQAVGQLAAWSTDAGWLGYPYPLALAHNRCAFDEGLARDLTEGLRGAAHALGVETGAWDEVFGDFHDVLDRGL
jgi:hypothetical protein